MTRKLTGQKIVIATHNRGKLEEFAELLKPHGVDAVSAGELGIPEPAETESTFLGNARIKAVNAAAHSGLIAIADDSGLCVDALDGGPGVYTADWAGPDRDRAAPALASTCAAATRRTRGLRVRRAVRRR